MTQATALVAGATGAVGRAVMTRLAGRPGWQELGLARRVPADPFLSADLQVPATLDRHAGALARVTHVFFALRIPAPDAAAEAAVNAAALRTLLDALARAGAPVQHVCLVHGTKWYGCHLGPYRTPAEETDPRHAGANFYFSQHDLLRRLQAGRSWTWSTLRPHTVWCFAPGTGNSLVNAIGIYALLCREAGLPLHFPGPDATYHKRSQGISADLLADAMIWAATNPRCAGEDFNVTNGDIFRWVSLWPRVAAMFDLACGDPDPAALEVIEGRSGELWPRLGLLPARIEDFVSWRYLRGLLAMRWDDVSSLRKLRQFGFTEQRESEAAFLAELEQACFMRKNAS